MTIRMDRRRGRAGLAVSVPGAVLAALALLAVLAVPASAQHGQVHQCVDGRNVSYQATPCTKGRSMKQWPLAPAVPTSAAATQATAPGAAHPLVRTRKLRAAAVPRLSWRRATRARPYAAGRRGAVRAGSCEAARAQQAAAYEKVGLKRGFALSSYWDNKVQQACR